VVFFIGPPSIAAPITEDTWLPVWNSIPVTWTVNWIFSMPVSSVEGSCIAALQVSGVLLVTRFINLLQCTHYL
jgi:hypothetical protein